jgi:hypothetical protein
MHDLFEFLSTHDKLVTAFTAIAALMVSFLSILLAVLNTLMQLRHHHKSVLPIGHIGVEDYEHKLLVRLWNHGVGPMIVERMQITETKTEQQISNAIIDAMPQLPNDYAWTIFAGDISGRAIAARDSIILIQLDGDPSNDGFKEIRNQVRKALAPLSVKVEYKNIYNKKMPPTRRVLDWFARPTWSTAITTIPMPPITSAVMRETR